MREDEPDAQMLLRVHADKVVQRQIDELIGLAKGALLDGAIDEVEAKGILAWLQTNSLCLHTWPANILYERLSSMLADSRLDEEESGELLGLLMQIAAPKGGAGSFASTTLPLTAPAPELSFPGRSYCFTGVFEFGSRADCHHIVETLGGEPAKGVTKRLDYLIIGSVGSEFWRHSTFGTKILKAAQYAEDGVPIHIVSEAHWTSWIRKLIPG